MARSQGSEVPRSAGQPEGLDVVRLGGTIAGGSMLGGSVASLITSTVAASGSFPVAAGVLTALGGFPIVAAGAAIGALAGLGLSLGSAGKDHPR